MYVSAVAAVAETPELVPEPWFVPVPLVLASDVPVELALLTATPELVPVPAETPVAFATD